MAGSRLPAPGAALALSVHGPAGVLDLVVPPGASALDVAREYAAQSRIAAVPALHTRLGQPLDAHGTLTTAGIGSGDVLVATLGSGAGAGARSDAPVVVPYPSGPSDPGPLSALWFSLAAALAVVAGWLAAHTASSSMQNAAVALLVAGAVTGVLPVGRLASHRMLSAPAFAGAAAFAVAWSPVPERLPTIIGVAALTAAVTAAVARSFDRRSDEALRVWIVVGVAVFVVSGLCALMGAAPQVVWSLLLVGAVLAVRLVPGYAVDVPDQLLLDLGRLAVTAWSARERPVGRRGRTVVPRAAVAEVAARGARIVTASSVAILLLVALCSPLLLATATLPLDRIGARCLVGLCGATLLLAARSYRHAAARSLLRAAGLAAWAALAAFLLVDLDAGLATTLAITAIGVAALLVAVAVATGRGWRSAWWSRRAEVAEGLLGSAAVASVFVSVGLFRSLWELTS